MGKKKTDVDKSNALEQVKRDYKRLYDSYVRLKEIASQFEEEVRLLRHQAEKDKMIQLMRSI